MSTIESSEAVQPYLNPDYWGGHSIGYGQNLGKAPRLQIFGRAVKDSKLDLQQRLTLMEEVVTLETYGGGETFDAEGYELGTVVIFRDESLRGNPNKLSVDVESLKGRPLPNRPFDVSPSFEQESRRETIKDVNLLYTTVARWGIVAVNRARKKVLHSVTTGVVEKSEDGRVLIAMPGLFTEENPIEIGETKHYASKYGDRLKRVNILNVVGYGEPEKKKQRVAQRTARLAFGHNN